MVSKRTCEFLLFDELAAFIICVLVWLEAHKWANFMTKMIWKPLPCTSIENSPPEISTPTAQLMSGETDSDFEIIDEECHTDCCSNFLQETLDALNGFVFNTKEGETTAEGNSTLDADDCTSEVNLRVTAFYIKVADYLAKVYSIVSPGNTTPEVRLTSVLKLMLPVIQSRDNSTLHVKFDVPKSSDTTNEVGETITSADNHALNENDRTEALIFANKVFDFISHKLVLDGKIFKEAVCSAQECECKIMYKFVANMLSTFGNTASSDVDFAMDKELFLIRLVTHLTEVFALVKPGDTTPETNYKIIKETLLYKTKFDDIKSAKSEHVVRHSNTESGDNATGTENAAISFLKRVFDDLFVDDGLKNPKVEEATVAETDGVVGNSTTESGDDTSTTGAENTTLNAHEEDEVICFIERIFNNLFVIIGRKNPTAVEAVAETEGSTPEAPVTFIEKFIIDMVCFLNREKFLKYFGHPDSNTKISIQEEPNMNEFVRYIILRAVNH